MHNANLPAFQGRTIYLGPHDLKNLNRSFPGDASGSITERIAHTLTEEVIKQSDYLMDIHSGDANESLQPSYTAYYAEAGSDEVKAKSRRMTVAFGLDTIVLFGGDLSTPQSIDAQVAGDPAQVRAQSLGVAQLVERPPGADEHLLHHIVDVARPQPARADGADRGGVDLEEALGIGGRASHG